MRYKNKYAYHSHISEKKLREIIRLFALDLEANKIAIVTGISRKTINKYIGKIRERLAEECEKEGRMNGIVEVDETYVGPRRVKGKRGRGAGSKQIVFGIYKRNGSVYTEIVPNAKKKTLQKVIRGQISYKSIIHSDRWKGYDGLVDLGYKKHKRVTHSKDEFVRGTVHINGIESFWGTVKTRLSKRRGIPKRLLYYHLKECEWRFNHRHENIYKLLLQVLKDYPLK